MRFNALRAIHALVAICALLVSTRAEDDSKPTQSSLCGEHLDRQTGFLDGIYYAFFKSSSTKPPRSIPVVLWLSGGPGCSGLVGALFELGPCSFDDEANLMQLNAYSWTNIAHVIFVDQPRGTGFSDRRAGTWAWTERGAMRELAAFVNAFFKKNPSLRTNDFYIFGESFGGHYAPDLSALLLKTDPQRWSRILKGVGIGNGVVSSIAGLQTYLDFAEDNKYANDLLNVSKDTIHSLQNSALELMLQCRASRTVQAAAHGRMRARALDDDCDDDVPQVCHDAVAAASSFEQSALTGIVSSGHNMYDLRRPCHLADPLGLCYHFSRLQDYVNQPQVLNYFGVPNDTWSLCSMDVMTTLRGIDFWGESEGNVAYLLDKGVRVLVYAGDADAMAPWNMQERWTSDMVWGGSLAYRSKPTVPLRISGKDAGTLRTARGLSLVRVYESGHMVPHDQPEIALELLRLFTLGRNSSILT